MVCLICGAKNAHYKLKKNGKNFGFCVSCKDDVVEAFDGKNVPLVWVGEEDLTNRYEDKPDTLKEIRKLTRDDYIDMANTIGDWFFDHSSDWFGNSLCEALEIILTEKEEKKLKEMPKKLLPLMVGAIKYPQNEKILTERLKGKTS